jgi:hypothetical protein
VRVTPALYNGPDDTQRLAAALETIAARRLPRKVQGADSTLLSLLKRS